MFCSQHSKINPAFYASGFTCEDGLVFDVARLQMLEPTQKTAKDEKGNSTNYNEMYPLYDCGESHPRLETLHLQTCELTSYDGIKDSAFGKANDYSIAVKLYEDNADFAELIDTINEIHKGLAQILFKYKGKVGLSTLKKDDPHSTGFKNPINYPLDKQTGERLEGKPPALYLKLLSKGSGLKEQKTVFMGVNGKEISWDLLKGVKIRFIPLIRFEKIYIGGGRASLQMKVVSAIVTAMESQSAIGLQMSTLKRLEQNKELVDSLNEQLEKRQSAIAGSSSSEVSEKRPASPRFVAEPEETPQVASVSFPAIPDFANILGSAKK